MGWKHASVVVAMVALAPVCAQAAAVPRETVWASAEPSSLVASGSSRSAAGLTRVKSSPPFSASTTRRESGKPEARFADLPVPLQATISKRLGQERGEYAAREQRRAGAGRAPQVRFVNAAHGLSIENDGQRLLVHMRQSGVRWGLAWQRLGCRAAGDGKMRWMRVGRATTQRIEANQAEWVRLAGRARVREWAVNGPVGLQHGFTLEEAPGLCAGASGAEEVVVELGTMGAGASLGTEVEAGKRGVVVKRQGSGEAVLRYGGLFAYDGKGRELEAWMEVSEGQGLRLHVATAGADYPVVIDPFVQQANLTASDGAIADNFGSSVAISGDTVVVGAPEDDIGIGPSFGRGSAYVFVKPGTGWGNMTQTAKLTASDGAMNDNFGSSVAISGDTVVVGAPRDDIGSNTDQGSAYVFVKPGTGWANMTQTAKLTASDGAIADNFGSSVAISGDTVVVGAPEDDIGIGPSFGRGSAYVFVKPGTGWGNMTQTAKLTASDGAMNDNFGSSVAISGDTVVVGAPRDDIGSNTDQGSAYVFVKPGTGWANMTQTAKLTASDGDLDDGFGNSVAISGDTVVVGAPKHATNSNFNRGSAYVFVKPGTGWANMTQTAKLTASDGAVTDQLGFSVAISGDTVVVGAPSWTSTAKATRVRRMCS